MKFSKCSAKNLKPDGNQDWLICNQLNMETRCRQLNTNTFFWIFWLAFADQIKLKSSSLFFFLLYESRTQDYNNGGNQTSNQNKRFLWFFFLKRNDLNEKERDNLIGAFSSDTKMIWAQSAPFSSWLVRWEKALGRITNLLTQGMRYGVRMENGFRLLVRLKQLSKKARTMDGDE